MEGYDAEWIKYESQHGKFELPPDANTRREAFNNSMIEMAKQLPPTHPGVTVNDEDQVPNCPRLRIYHPPYNTDDKLWQERKLPCIIYCHGGGWLSGNLDTEDHMCRTVCAGAHCVVVSVDYGLWPEVNFPKPIEDCMAAFEYACANAKYLATDPNRFVFCGGSAGAALALASTYRIIADGQSDRIAGLVSLQGLLVDPAKVAQQYRHLHNSYGDNGGPIPIVNGDEIKWALANVAGDKALNDASQFPLNAAPDALNRFPKTYIINTGKEALRDDGLVLSSVLKDLSIPVRRDCMPGLPHYFWFLPVHNAGQKFRDLLVDGVKWVLSAENA